MGAVTTAKEDVPARRFLLLLAAIVVVLAAGTALVLFVPGFLFVVVADQADNVVNTATALIAGGISLLAWVRYRETGQPDSLFHAAAFLALFSGAALGIILALIGLDEHLGFDRSAPGQAPLYLWTYLRVIVSPLLLLGAIAVLRGWPPTQARWAPVVLAGPSIVVIILSAGVLLGRDNLPALIPPETLQIVTQPLDRYDPALLSPPMVALQLFVAGLYLAAAWSYGRSYGRGQGGRPYDGYLAVGLVVAAFSQIHFAIVPGAYSDVLTSGDVLHIGFSLLVGIGVAAAARRDLVELREANVNLQHLRRTDAERIALEERARLARDVHDGLVQDLWLARLTHGQLIQTLAEATDLPADVHDAAERIDGILEDALAEARQAVVSLQTDPDTSFGSLLRRYVEDYSDRFGLEVECAVEGEPIQLPGERQAEVLRICREALNNVRKHADATLVRVRLESDGYLIRLTVRDNGRGWDQRKQVRKGFGLKGMSERARELGGRLSVDSQPMGGTSVTLELTHRAVGG
jgi:signal transduction histidine kinase